MPRSPRKPPSEPQARKERVINTPFARGAPPADGFQRQVYSQPPFSRQPQTEDITPVKPPEAPAPPPHFGTEPKLVVGRNPKSGASARLSSVEAQGEVGTFAPPQPDTIIEVPSAALKIDARRPRVSVRKHAPRMVVIRSKTQVLVYSHAMIHVLEEALNYDPLRHGNQPAPELRDDLQLDQPVARSEIRELIDELKRLNAFLESTKAKGRAPRQTVVDVKKHLNKFLERYTSTMGTSAGVLTVGAVASLLTALGAGDVVAWALAWKAVSGLKRGD